MKTIHAIAFVLIVSLLLFQSCKQETVQPVDFSKYVATNSECSLTGAPDSTQWMNNVLEAAQNEVFLTFADNIFITDTLIDAVQVTPPCPNPSNGFFIWNINPSQQTRLRVAIVNTASDILYYNAYRLNPGSFTIGFDLRSLTAFHKSTNYRMYFGFYTGLDSLYYTGHGDIRLQ